MKTHGNKNTYAWGCRCAPCTAANTEAMRRYNRKRGVRPREVVNAERRAAMKHGTVSMYRNAGCRCAECRAAVALERKVIRAKARTKPVPDHIHGTINGYQNYSCRCAACFEAYRARYRSTSATNLTDARPELSDIQEREA